MKKDWNFVTESDNLVKIIGNKLTGDDGERWFNALCLFLNNQRNLTTVLLKDIELGVFASISDLINEVRKNGVSLYFSPYDASVMSWLKLYKVSKVKKVINPVVMSVGNLSYPGFNTLIDIYRIASERGLKEMSVETALMFILLNRRSLEIDEYYYFATKPLNDKKNNLILLRFMRKGVTSELSYIEFSHGMTFSWDTNFVFIK